jgi:hypothetical protein
MKFGNSQHSNLKVITKANKIRSFFKKTRAEIDVDTSVDDIYGKKTIVIFWTAWIYLDEDLTHTISCGFETKCIVENDVESEDDFERVLTIVASSCDNFFDKISRFSETSPLIEPKFQILALRILEALILIQ